MRAIVNPANGQTVGEVPEATAADVDGAVVRATDAFAEWRRSTVRTRRDVLRERRRG